MMGLDVIHEMTCDAAREAKKLGRNPAVLSTEDVTALKAGDLSSLKIPTLGSYLPKGFKRVSLEHFNEQDAHGVYMDDNDGFGAYFVDSSGCGGLNEPAMPLVELCQHLRPGYGYAVVETGEFQVKVGVFRYVGDRDHARSRTER